MEVVKMKKIQFVWVLLSLAAMLATMAAAPMAASAIALVEVRNDTGGNVIFVFSVEGHFSKSQLKGFIQVQGMDANFKMSCNQVDDSKVQCTTSKKAGGNNVIVTFGGATFWAYVPAVSTTYCYPQWDWDSRTDTSWRYDGQVCQDVPAVDGDVINNSLWNGETYYDYEYFSTGVDNAYCGWANAGSGYYYKDDYGCY